MVERYQRYCKLLYEVGARAAYAFGRKALRAAEVANQYWCEKQVWLRLKNGQPETEARSLGREGHEWALFGSTKVKLDEVWREALRPNRRGPYEVREFPLLAEFLGVPVEGRPDKVLLWRGSAVRVVEYKFMREPHIFGTTVGHQVRMYGLLLELMGFDTARLECEAVAWPAERRKLVAVEDVLADEMGDDTAVLGVERRREPYDPKRAREELEWAIPFWRGEREPVPTKLDWKCRSCDQRGVCGQQQ